MFSDETALPKAANAPIPVEKRETPPIKHEVKAKMSDPTPNGRVTQAAKRPLSRLVSGPAGIGPKPRPARASSPANPLQSLDSMGSSCGDSSVGSVRGLNNKEPITSGW